MKRRASASIRFERALGTYAGGLLGAGAGIGFGAPGIAAGAGLGCFAGRKAVDFLERETRKKKWRK